MLGGNLPWLEGVSKSQQTNLLSANYSQTIIYSSVIFTFEPTLNENAPIQLIQLISFIF